MNRTGLKGASDNTCQGMVRFGKSAINTSEL